MIRIFVLYFIALTVPAFANQMPEAQKVNLTGWNSSASRQWLLGYALNDLVGFSARFDAIDGTAGERNLILSQLDFILKTWQRPGSLTRAYLTVAYGAQKHPWGGSGAALIDLEVSKETDRFYFGERFQFVRMVSHQPFNGMRFRGGYSSEILVQGQMKTWLILQIERNGAVSEKLVITPMARFKTQSFFAEFGAALSGEWSINLGAIY